jgi:transposase InsO family protein
MQSITNFSTKALEQILRIEKLSRKAKQRLKWVEYIAQGQSPAQASRHFDIPYSTIKYWNDKFNSLRLKSLENRSTRPNKTRISPVPLRIVEDIVKLRKKTGYDKVKLQYILRKQGINIGRSRIQIIVTQAGLKRRIRKRKSIKRKNRRHMYSVPETVYQTPGGLVYLDVKHLKLPGNMKAYQFVAIDHATRILFTKVYRNITSRSATAFLVHIQEQMTFPKIEYIGSDNGSEFLGEFEKALEDKSIPHVFSSPRSPKQNPFVERVIQTIISEYYWKQGLPRTIEELNIELEKYVKEYNRERPHYGLELRTPWEQLAVLQSC